jgi:hypothetical protein
MISREVSRKPFLDHISIYGLEQSDRQRSSQFGDDANLDLLGPGVRFGIAKANYDL